MKTIHQLRLDFEDHKRIPLRTDSCLSTVTGFAEKACGSVGQIRILFQTRAFFRAFSVPSRVNPAISTPLCP